jgi:hypothetical protein
MSAANPDTKDNSRKRKRNQNPAAGKQLNEGTSHTLYATELAKKRIELLRKRVLDDMGKSKNTYVYPPLKEQHGQDIRVLVIEPGKGEDPIKCRLVPSALGSSTPSGTEAYPYTALSYYWGEGDPIHDITVTSYNTLEDRMEEPNAEEKAIFVLQKHKEWRKTGKIYVRTNLYVALQRFRKKNKLTTMWIDALCIDQGDKYERSAQVKKMHELYIQAENVTIWLGDGSSADSPEATPRCCFKFLRQILDLQNLDSLLDHIAEKNESRTVQKAKHIVDLMCNKWFSRRWIIQELALARKAEVVYGKQTMPWPDFADAIAIFIKSQERIRPGLAKLYVETAISVPELSSVDGVKNLGANALVDFINNLFRRSENGDIQQRMMTLEALVSNLLAFEATNPRDTIYAVLSLAKDTHHLSTDLDERLLPAYQNTLLDVYTDFIGYCIDKSQSLDILLRHWAPSEKREKHQVPLRELVDQAGLPTWIPSIHKSAHGAPSQRIRGRSNGDSFVGTSIRSSRRNYSATLDLPPEIVFEKSAHATQKPKYSGHMFVQGLRIGKIEKISHRAPEAMVFREAFGLAGFDHETWLECQQWAEGIERVPEGFWRTIVADRGPEGTNPPSWYPRACLESLKHLRPTGDLRPDDVIDLPRASSIAKLFMERVKDVLWERRFVRIKLEGKDGKTTYGLTPRDTEARDIVCVLFGCSVPVVLRQHGKRKAKYFSMIGECFVYGMMDGEAVSGNVWEAPYNNAKRFELR